MAFPPSWPSDSEMDQQMTGTQLLLSALLQNTVQGTPGPEGLTLQPDGPYDFYQQPNMSEARLCLPVLEQLALAVGQRLEEWPEHPALVQVKSHEWPRLWAYKCLVSHIL